MELARRTYAEDVRIHFELMTTVSTNGSQKDTLQDVGERVLKVIALTKRLPREAVTMDSSFESLGVDSLDRLNILFDLESEFDIEINDEDAKRVENIPQMVTGVVTLLQARDAAAHPVAATPANSQLGAEKSASADDATIDPATKPASSGE